MTLGDAVVIAELVDEEAMFAPLHGIVNAEGNGDVEVLWRNGEKNFVPTSQLLKVFPGDEKVVGKWMQITGLPTIDTDDDFFGLPPKSPATAGVVIDVFGTSPFGAAEPTNQWIVVSTENGRGSFLLNVADPPDPEVPNQFFEQPGRRNV